MNGLMTQAREVHKRRVLAGDRVDFARTLAEVGLFVKFGVDFNINCLVPTDHGVDIVGSDMNGSEFRVVSKVDKGMWLVESDPTYDNYVFVDPVDATAFTVEGWMPGYEVIGAPKKAKFYTVFADNMCKLEGEFELVNDCPSVPCNANAIWDSDFQAWDCVNCERFRFDQWTRDFDTNDSDSFEVLA